MFLIFGNYFVSFGMELDKKFWIGLGTIDHKKKRLSLYFEKEKKRMGYFLLEEMK